jgi:transposase-like protein
MGRRTFSKEYKLKTIKQVIEEGKRITEVSSPLGITEQTVYRWLREYDKYTLALLGQAPVKKRSGEFEMVDRFAFYERTKNCL